MAYGILDGFARDVCVDELHEEDFRNGSSLSRFLCGVEGTTVGHGAVAGHCEVGAVRVCDHKIPTEVEGVENIILDVFTSIFGGLEVTGPGIVAACAKGTTDHSRTLAGN